MDFLKEELKRLRSVSPDWKPFPGSIAIVRFRVVCPGNAGEVSERTKKVLETVVAVREKGVWSEDTLWKSVLPGWFVEACAEDMSFEDAEKWLEKWKCLPPEEQARQASQQRWSLSDWLWWFSPGPDERQWRWVASEVLDEDCFIVGIAVTSLPTAYGALKWILRASGASSVEEDM